MTLTKAIACFLACGGVALALLAVSPKKIAPTVATAPPIDNEIPGTGIDNPPLLDALVSFDPDPGRRKREERLRVQMNALPAPAALGRATAEAHARVLMPSRTATILGDPADVTSLDPGAETRPAKVVDPEVNRALRGLGIAVAP